MKESKIYFLILVSIILLSCGSNKIHTEKVSGKDLNSYSTFAYLPNANAETLDQDFGEEDVNVRVIETINENMKTAGYDLDRDNPDLLVLINTRADINSDAYHNYVSYPYSNSANSVQPFYNPYYYSGYNTFSSIVGYNGNPARFNQSSVNIYLIDRETKEVVWRGIARDNIYDQVSSDAVRDLVNAIFEEFPVKD